MEILLLARCDYLVANRRVEGHEYLGRSDAVSTFVRLASTIGFHGRKYRGGRSSDRDDRDGNRGATEEDHAEADDDSHIVQCRI